METPMLLDGKHKVEISDEMAKNIVSHFSTPDEFDGKTLEVPWNEERVLDMWQGMMWPAMIGLMVTKLYQKKGHKVKGFSGSLDLSRDDACVVTFKKQ